MAAVFPLSLLSSSTSSLHSSREYSGFRSAIRTAICSGNSLRYRNWSCSVVRRLGTSFLGRVSPFILPHRLPSLVFSLRVEASGLEVDAGDDRERSRREGGEEDATLERESSRSRGGVEGGSTGRGRESGNYGDGESGEVDIALSLDAEIPNTARELVEKVRSKAYDMRRRLESTRGTGGYDVVEANPWGRGEEEKPLYVLAQPGDKLCTMPTRRARSEVENELLSLFRKSSRSRSECGRPQFRMHVEDVREGVLVFEEEAAAAQYCAVLEGHGKKCVGIAQVPAKEVFSICQKSNALAIIFRRGITPPGPDQLQMNLRARKRSLED